MVGIEKEKKGTDVEIGKRAKVYFSSNLVDCVVIGSDRAATDE